MLCVRKPHHLLLIHCFCSYLQLEKIIGKLKTERYGSKILEEIKKFVDSDEPDYDKLNGESSKKRPTKKRKTKNNVVLIESSEDDK